LRYLRVETISFTDSNGRTYPIKDTRTFEEYTIRKRIEVTERDKLDEIASRVDVYGIGGYTDSYKLFDQNRVQLVDHALALDRIKTLEIPD
jgi:translation elongation factor P/translation initiation factor 5A